MKTEQKVIWMGVVVIVAILLLAFYGWYTGAWENANAID